MLPRTVPILAMMMSALAMPASGSFEVEWETRLATPGGCGLHGCCPTDDGGLAAAGHLVVSDPDLPVAYVAKIGPQGDVQWESRTAWEASCSAREVVQTGAGYTVCGEVTARSGDQDGFVLRLDYFGRELWRRRLGGAGSDRLRDMVPSADGGVFLVGDTRTGEGPTSLWVLRLDAEGETLWTRTFGGESSMTGWGIGMMPDSLLAVCGGSGEDMMLTVMDSGGNRLLCRSFDNAGGMEYGRGVAASSAGDLCIGGSCRSRDSHLMDAFVLATDGSGDELWRRVLGGDANDCGAKPAFIGDSLLLVYNTMSAGSGGYDVAIELFAPSGKVLMSDVIGDSDWNRVCDLEAISEKRIFLAGSSGSADAERESGWAVLVGIAPDGGGEPADEAREGVDGS